jgi:prepilin-type N-terminal cleavage/methylation domain-containing protein
MDQFNRSNRRKALRRDRAMHGFSLVELLVVFLIIGIMIAISVPYLAPSKKAHSTDNLVLMIHDYFRRASQQSIADLKRTRVRINTSAAPVSATSSIMTPQYSIQLIAENEPGDSSDDEALFTESLPDPLVIGNPVVGTPVGVATTSGTPLPPSPFNFIAATYTSGVVDFYFTGEGACTSSSGVPLSATVFVFVPTVAGGNTPADKTLTRAVTLFGPTASSRLWRCTFDSATSLPKFVPR